MHLVNIYYPLKNSKSLQCSKCLVRSLSALWIFLKFFIIFDPNVNLLQFCISFSLLLSCSILFIPKQFRILVPLRFVINLYFKSVYWKEKEKHCTLLGTLATQANFPEKLNDVVITCLTNLTISWNYSFFFNICKYTPIHLRQQ